MRPARADLRRDPRPPQVEQRPFDLTIAEHALELATDETHRVIGAFGGQRGSKTHTAAQWTVRQWMLKGGLGAFGWWCAPSRKQAWEICVGKLAGFGPKGDTPICPDLIVRYPKSEDSGQQRVTFLDGAHIDLIPLDERRKGGNAKGFGPHWMVVDEVCEVKSIATWRVLRGRVNVTPSGERAQIFMPSTPMPGHWAKTEIVDVVKRGANPDYTFGYLSMALNVFIPRSEVDDAIRDAGGPDDPVCKREVFGEWDTAGAKLWTAFDPLEQIVETKDLAELGLRDVTPGAIRRIFGRKAAEAAGINLDYIAGHDFNRSPQNTVVCKIGVPKDQPHRAEHEVLVAVDHVQSWDADAEVHGWRLAAQYPKLAIVCDPQGAQIGFKRRKAPDESPTEASDLGRAGHLVIPAHVSDDNHPYSPPQITSCDLMNRLMRQGRVKFHRGLGEMFTALETQQRTARGGVDKSDEAKNRVSGPTDGWRYLAWAAYGCEVFAD